ncbi:MAG: zf-HC2 domain-containing protein [Planctomycetes bacterium]|nr:zf-HC2 domain-containing protein [Planctomycetota bacterium]
MTCKEVADFLMDYSNGELSQTERAIFEEHLGICPECVAYVQSYEITIKASKTACDQVHDEVPEDLIRAILAAKQKSDPS